MMPGQMMQVQSPNTGMLLQVTVPQGAQSGSSFPVIG
jgi:hypothetical protein